MTQHERFARWYAAHREEYNAKRRAAPKKPRKPLTPEQRARKNARKRELYRLNHEHEKGVRDAWKDANREAEEYYRIVSYNNRKARMETDADYYAHFRKQVRDALKRRADKTRKRKFVERPAGRIPDYMTKADVRREVRRSTFVENNVSDEAMMANRDYSRHLYRERWGIDD